jgi:hypothetical protein
LIALPALTVAVVIAALVGPARERAVRAVRLYGGPTLGTQRPTFRLELVESRQGIDRLAASRNVDVVVRTVDGHEAAWSGSVPASGVTDIELPALPSDAAREVVVAEGERELARGKLSLDSETWAREATRRGGFVDLRHPPGFDFRVGVERGVLAVPFTDDLLVVLGRVGDPRSGVEIELDADGADLAAQRAVTDALARASVAITPREHHVTVRLRAVVDGTPLQTSVALPVVPGAIDARRVGEKLLVSSPVPRERAYVTLVTERYRLLGASLDLAPNADGGGSAEFALPPLPDEPVWAVTSSAIDLESPARVGWPIDRRSKEVRTTFDVPEQLRVDGLPLAQRRELARQKRVRWAVVALCAVALLLEVLLLARHSSRAQAELARHFAKSGLSSEHLAPARTRSGVSIVAVLIVALAFGLLAVFALLAES